MIETDKLGFSVAPDTEIFAIGDIHGHAVLLDRLLAHVAAIPRIAGKRRLVVFLGDLINRGPMSIPALDLAIDAKRRTQADEVIGLWGNHEQMLHLAMLPAHDPRCISARSLWMQHGGPRFLAELGIASPFALADALGERRLAWWAHLRPYYISGGILFVHGGVNPRIPLDTFLAAPVDVDIARLDYDLHWAWIRYTFCRFIPSEAGMHGHHGLFVAHGHTQGHLDVAKSAAEQIGRDRINLDGGSYATGRARMARFVDDTLTLYEEQEKGAFPDAPVEWV